MKVIRRKLTELKNDPANARKHSARNIKAIKDSLEVFGQQKPIVIDTRGVIIAGNGTYQAASDLNWDDIDVVETKLDPAHAQAFGIADNRTSELAEWDNVVLNELLGGMDKNLADILAFEDFDLELDEITDKPTPNDFAEVEADIQTEHRCRSCVYEWSGK